MLHVYTSNASTSNAATSNHMYFEFACTSITVRKCCYLDSVDTSICNGEDLVLFYLTQPNLCHFVDPLGPFPNWSFQDPPFPFRPILPYST